jgi:SPFH domain / Band 7 family
MLLSLWNQAITRLDALWVGLIASWKRRSQPRSGLPRAGSWAVTAWLRRGWRRLVTLVRFLLWPLLAGVLLWQAVAQFVHRVPLGEVHVRVSRFGAGVMPRDYSSGWSLGWPGLEHWVSFNSEPVWLRFGLGGGPRLELRTRDDNPASLDVAVLYRIAPGQFHQLAARGLARDLTERVRATAEDTLRGVCAALESEQWFSSDQRQQVAAATLQPLTKNLSALFVEPLEVRISQVTFSKEFEQKLQESRLAYQAQRRIEAQQAVDRAKQELTEANSVNARGAAEVKSQWDKRLAADRAQSAAALARLRAEASVTNATRLAAAEAAYSAAVSSGEVALGEAMSLTHLDELEVLAAPGGDAYLAAQAAQHLRLEALHFDPEESGAPLPLDLDAWQALLTRKP